MALKVSKIEVWAADIQDQPGGLAQVLEKIGDAGGSLEFVIARRDDRETGTGTVFMTPIKGRKVQEAARAAGANPANNVPTLRVEGPDKAGMGARMSRAMADAGVNVRGVSGAVIGNKFVAYIGFDTDADADRASQAIMAMSGRRQPAGRARGAVGARPGTRPGRARRRMPAG
jgi:hypothetical protein